MRARDLGRHLPLGQQGRRRIGISAVLGLLLAFG
jgi:hypothetical protein